MTKAFLLIFNEKAFIFRVGGKEVWRKTKENEIHFIEPRFYYLETVLIGQPLKIVTSFRLNLCPCRLNQF